MYNRCFEEDSTGAEWTKRPVHTPLKGLWEELWFETVGRWRDIRTQRETPIYLEPDTEPVDTEDEFLQVLYRFFKRIVVMGLSDHVDLSAFYSIVIHPHLPDGPFGQIWEFGYSLLVVCLNA